jgi:4a-hydroxytetrahydrobiopterin dehydratase
MYDEKKGITMPQKLTPDEVTKGMAALQGWTLADNGLSIAKSFRFKDFSQAWAFMNRSALLAEKMNHHPEWFNVYNRVDVTLNTHDAKGLTELDFRMASAMDRFSA